MLIIVLSIYLKNTIEAQKKIEIEKYNNSICYYHILLNIIIQNFLQTKSYFRI